MSFFTEDVALTLGRRIHVCLVCKVDKLPIIFNSVVEMRCAVLNPFALIFLHNFLLYICYFVSLPSFCTFFESSLQSARCAGDFMVLKLSLELLVSDLVFKR